MIQIEASKSGTNRIETNCGTSEELYEDISSALALIYTAIKDKLVADGEEKIYARIVFYALFDSTVSAIAENETW